MIRKNPRGDLPQIHESAYVVKGSLWQGNGGRGIVHRSPAVAADEAPRVLLAMDASW